LKDSLPIENLENLAPGGHLLLIEKHNSEWRIPIWVGERISRMWKQQEDVILRKMLGEKT
jgi:hypothetical protein